jgi:hypothetical protein
MSVPTSKTSTKLIDARLADPGDHRTRPQNRRTTPSQPRIAQPTRAEKPDDTTQVKEEAKPVKHRKRATPQVFHRPRTRTYSARIDEQRPQLGPAPMVLVSRVSFHHERQRRLSCLWAEEAGHRACGLRPVLAPARVPKAHQEPRRARYCLLNVIVIGLRLNSSVVTTHPFER